MKRKKIENVERSLSPEEIAFQSAEEQYQEEFEAEERYKEELRMEGAELEQKRITNSLKEFLNPIQKAFLESMEKKGKRPQRKKNEEFTINGIDIPKLVTDLEKRDFFDIVFKEDIIAWFNGIPPVKPISMNVSATIFVSLIADMRDLSPKVIKNSKEFIYCYIQKSFLFNGRKPEISTIKQIMKPKSLNRVSSIDNAIPNYQNFKR